MKDIKVLVYPKDKNPYQELLYRNMPESIKVTYLINPTKSHILGVLLLPFLVVMYRLRGYRIFHLHWVYTFQFTVTNKFFYTFPFKIFFIVYLFIFLVVCRLFFRKFIWTAHDIHPHGDQFFNNDLVVKILTSCTHKIIVHSKYSKQELINLGVNREKIAVIPIGNYQSVYENSITRDSALEKLHIPQSSFVFGFFGRVEIYKGVIELIQSFNCITNKNAYLVIAGPCDNPMLKKTIEELASKNTHIQLYLKRIPDKELQIYINSMDITVFPFRKITTSSSVILSLSFGKAVIVPRVGEMNEIPEKCAYHINHGDFEQLKKIMNSVLDSKQDVLEKGRNSFEYASKLDWKTIAYDTSKLYN